MTTIQNQMGRLQPACDLHEEEAGTGRQSDGQADRRTDGRADTRAHKRPNGRTQILSSLQRSLPLECAVAMEVDAGGGGGEVARAIEYVT